MRREPILALALIAIAISGCSTSTPQMRADPASKGTLDLCRDLASTDPAYRARVIQLLIKRGATPEKCNQLIAGDRALAIAAVGVAAGVAVANSGGNGSGGGSGVAWDQFYNQYGQLTWRCRERATGEFADDYRCGGQPMVDAAWPGW